MSASLVSCPHTRAFMLQHRRVTRVPNTRKGRMLTKECSRCGVALPVTWPLGDATSNDRIPRLEMQLARRIADLCVLWEPGKEREELIARAVEVWSEVR